LKKKGITNVAVVAVKLNWRIINISARIKQVAMAFIAFVNVAATRRNDLGQNLLIHLKENF